MVCYVEAFILQNACVDAGLLWLAAAWRGARVRPRNILLGALCGALWAVFAAMAGGAFRSVWMQAIVSVGLVCLAVPSRSPLDCLASAGVVWLGALVIGGAVFMGLSMLPAGVVTGFAGMALVRRKHAPPPPALEVTIRYEGRTRTLCAISDTGNRALCPRTFLPVVFVPFGLFEPTQDRSLRVRTAAGARDMPCFIPEELWINGRAVRAAVAVAPAGMLDLALVPWALCAERTA